MPERITKLAKTYEHTPTAGGAALPSFWGTTAHKQPILVQIVAKEGNTGTVLVGLEGAIHTPLAAQAGIGIPTSDASEIYVKGNGTDKVAVMIYA